MVMPWNDVGGKAALIEAERQISGSDKPHGTLAQIVANYKLTSVALPSPLNSGGEFEYQFKGKVPSDTDLAKLVLEAEKLGYQASATKFATMQQLVVSQGDDVLLCIYAAQELATQMVQHVRRRMIVFRETYITEQLTRQPVQGTGQTTQPSVNVTVVYVTDPTKLNANLRRFVNKAATQYGLERALAKAGTPAGTP